MKEIEEIKVEIAEKSYIKESKRKEIIEKKISFLFGFLSIVIGSFVLKLDWINVLLESITTNNRFGILLKIEIILLLVGLILAFVFIYKAISLKQYRLNYPKNLSEALYSPAGKLNNLNDNKNLLNEYGAFLAVASEDNSKLNTTKSKWLKKAWLITIFIAIDLVLIVLTFVTFKI